MLLAIDTQVLVWLATGDRHLTGRMIDALGDPANDLVISAVVAWEFADLEKRGKFGAAINFAEVIERFDCTVIDFPAGAWPVALSLPHIHGDPVDRMQVAHAIEAGFTIISADRRIRDYPVAVIW